MEIEKRTRFAVVKELEVVQKQHRHFWSMRSHETEKGKHERLRLNRERKRLTQELSTFQYRLVGF